MDPEASELGWKDTIIANPDEVPFFVCILFLLYVLLISTNQPNPLFYLLHCANYTQVTYIRAKFDIRGLYVWHCHILSHEDNEMMVPYCVGTPGVDCPPELFGTPDPAPTAAPVVTPEPTEVPVGPKKPTASPVVTPAPTADPVDPTTPAPTPCVPRIIKFLVWDADKDEPTEKVIDGNDIEVCFPDGDSSIEAVASDCTSEVKLELEYPDGNTRRQTERSFPYMLFGDSGGTNIYGRRIRQGYYTISAYPDRDSTKTLSYDFRVINC